MMSKSDVRGFGIPGHLSCWLRLYYATLSIIGHLEQTIVARCKDSTGLCCNPHPTAGNVSTGSIECISFPLCGPMAEIL